MPTALRAASELAQAGQVAVAARVLEDALEGRDPPHGAQRTALLQALIGYLVTASRHREALARARELEAHLGVARVPIAWVDRLTFVVRLLAGVRPGGLVARALGWAIRAGALRHGATMEAVRAIQLAMFWYDVRACRRLSLLQLVLAKDAREVRRALAWLGYSYGYAGRRRGLSLLRRALADAHAAGDVATLVETYPLLAIAYQMCGAPRRALHYLTLFEARYARRSTFYDLLAHTNALVALVSLGRYEDLRAQLDRCFLGSFALDASRHHLQIYGVHAALMAVEGRPAQAMRALDLARAAAQANDNPLDWTIYLRLAALTFVLGRQWDAALACATEGLGRNRAYGRARWYERELRELAAIARDPSASTPRRTQLLEASARYLASEVRKRRDETPDGKLSALGEQLAEALHSHFEFDPSLPPTVDDLRAKLARTFKTEHVVVAKDLASLREAALRELAIDALGLTTESNGELRFACPGGKFFLGVECPRTSELKDELAIGVVLDRLDALSESLVKAAFRLVLAQYVFVHSIRISRDQQAKQQRAAAVGTLAQMLAHDVRRPFRMIRTALDVLDRARTPEELRRSAAVVLPEVQLATDTADALIADVMEISSGSSEAHPEPAAPEAILLASLVETLRSYPTADVRFRYDLAHRAALHVEPKKVQRLFANVLSNALQAMDHKGTIRIASRDVVEDGKRFVAFTIANDGPPIPDDDVPNLFEAFFTRHKASGTGLGLAIAHRVVTAHGGTIACVPTNGDGAAFRFTLPSIAARVAPPPQLPSHSAGITPLVAAAPRASDAPRLDHAARASRADVPSAAVTHVAGPEVAIVDDSRAFLMGWRRALAGSAGAHVFTSPEAFWSAVEGDATLLARLAAVVTDYRFANSRQTGVSFARAVKGRRADLPVFLWSSGYVSQREIQGVIDVAIEKDDVSWPALEAALGETTRKRALLLERGAS